MKPLMLGLTATLIGGAALMAGPAAAGVVFEFNDHAPRHFWGPPPPPPVFYAPRPVYYVEPAPVYRRPREVCVERVVRHWGPFGPSDRRVETCTTR